MKNPRLLEKFWGSDLCGTNLKSKSKSTSSDFCNGEVDFFLDIFDVGYLFLESWYGGTTSANGSQPHEIHCGIV